MGKERRSILKHEIKINDQKRKVSPIQDGMLCCAVHIHKMLAHTQLKIIKLVHLSYFFLEQINYGVAGILDLLLLLLLMLSFDFFLFFCMCVCVCYVYIIVQTFSTWHSGWLHACANEMETFACEHFHWILNSSRGEPHSCEYLQNFETNYSILCVFKCPKHPYSALAITLLSSISRPKTSRADKWESPGASTASILSIH